MPLTLRQLEVFLAAADDCNFRRAARRLGISQPSVSGRIRSLESYLGYELFLRSGSSGAKLTAEGKSFIAKAKHLVNGTFDLAQQGGSNKERSPLRLTVAIGPMLLRQYVMPELPTFCFEHPEIAADFVLLGGVYDGMEMLKHGTADIVFYNGDAPLDSSFESHVVRTSEMGIFGSPSLIKRIPPTIEAIAKAPFLMPQEHHTWTNWIYGRLSNAGIYPSNIVMRAQFPELRIRMAIEGRGLIVFFNEFVSNAELQQIGPKLQPANLVMVAGSRAGHAAATPLLEFLKRVAVEQRLLPCH